MAYTIIEVERKTGVPSTRLKFWIKKGLFPQLERDKNGVRYFSDSDIEWVHWIEYFRYTKMSIKDLRHYIMLVHQGDSSTKERLLMMQKQREFILEEIEKHKEILKRLDYKVDFYKQRLRDMGGEQ